MLLPICCWQNNLERICQNKMFYKQNIHVFKICNISLKVMDTEFWGLNMMMTHFRGTNVVSYDPPGHQQTDRVQIRYSQTVYKSVTHSESIDRGYDGFGTV
jgi:hypothetical protein